MRIKIWKISWAAIIICIHTCCAKDNVEAKGLDDQTDNDSTHMADNWELALSDEFEGSTLNAEYWIVEDGFWQKHVDNLYKPERVTVKNGSLFIAADKVGDKYESGKILGKDLISISDSCKIVAKICFPTGNGLKSAFWMLGTNKDEVGWPKCGEIDIIEQLGSESNRSHHNVHFWDESNSIKDQIGKVYLNSVSMHQVWHEITVERENSIIKYYINGRLIETKNISSVMTELQNPMYLILQLDVGTEVLWTGGTDDSTPWPSQLEVDYIRVYKKGGGVVGMGANYDYGPTSEGVDEGDPDNLLVDGNFENTPSNWKEDGKDWETLEYCVPRVHLNDGQRYDPAGIYSGNRSMAFTGHDIVLKHNVAVTPGKSYQYSYWARKEIEEANIAFSIKKAKEGGALENVINPIRMEITDTNTWVKFIGTYEPSEGVSEIILNFYKTGNQVGYIDEVVFKEL